MFKIRIAGLNIGINNRFRFVENVCRGFYTDSEHIDFTVSVSAEEIDTERTASNDELTEDFCESVCIYRAIAEHLPEYDAFILHCAAVETMNKSFCFTAPSGTGKTTHIGLWKTVYGEKVSVINGDKPIVRFKDGIPYVCGTPWGGKENLRSNRIFPLASICFLERGSNNSIEKITTADAFKRLIPMLYLSNNASKAKTTLELAGKALENSGLFSMSCNISNEAATMSYSAMTEAINK